MFWYLVIIVVTVWLALLRWQSRKVRNSAKQFPCDITAWPFIGHAHHCIGSNEDWMATLKKFGQEAFKQGGMTSGWLGNQFYLVLADPEAAEVILKVCLEKNHYLIRFIRHVTGDGLVFAPVKIWRPRRKAIAPIFNMKNLNSFVQVFARQSAVMVEQLQPAADGRDFSIWKYLTSYTFDSVCENTLGIQLNAQKRENHPFLEALAEGSKLVTKRVIQPWLHPEFVYNLLPQSRKLKALIQYVNYFVNEIIESKRKEFLQRKTKIADSDLNTMNGETKTFLDKLIELSDEPLGLDDVALREEVLVMLVAGTDTSAIGASFAAVMLSRYPEEQAKVYEEIQQVFGDSDRLLEAEDLPKLKYLEIFLKETLRMYPPVPVTVRDVHTDFTLPSGKSLVAGMGVVVNNWAMHRNQQYWGEDADQFRPERFLQPLRHPAQFMAFSYGIRNCLGYQYAMMSLKTVVASLVRRYRLLPPAGLSREELRQELRVKFDIMMKHVDNYVLRLEPRE